MGIVERIQNELKEKGSNIKNLEKELGIGNGTIRRWDERSPQCDKLSSVANYLNVSLDWLVFGKESGELNEEEQNLLNAYRYATPAIKTATRKLLDLPEPEPERSSCSRTG